MTRPRVALVSLTPLATGGIETHLLQLVRGLKHEVEFVLVGDILPEYRASMEAEGVPVVRVTATGKFDLRSFTELRRVFRDRAVSIVHTHDTRGGLLGRLAGRSLRLACIHTVHTPAFFLKDRGLGIRVYQRAESALNRWATRTVVFVSPTIQALYVREGLVRAAQSACIPNGIEPFWFERGKGATTVQPREHERGSGEVRFIYVGRLSPEKDVLTLLHAFARALAELPQARLTIVGDGPERARLERTAVQLGCANRLRWMGSITRQGVRAELRAADVFVLPSRFESMSYTLLEAMACGVACVATRVGGNADLIRHGETGMLVPWNDPPALADAMLRLARSREERARLAHAANRAARVYSLEAMLERSLALYNTASLAALRHHPLK
jgi:glycosyltransferase involved in cell wall biosynthesis